jgi:hypothetical protein
MKKIRREVIIMANSLIDYPVQLSIDYPDRALNKLTTFFRLFTVIPIAIILSLLVGNSSAQWTTTSGWDIGYAYGGITMLPLVLMILFRQKYPRWWFDWNVALTKFGMRVAAYMALLDDVYPSTDEEQSVHINIPYPDVANELSRGLPLVKWFLAIPHFIVLAFLLVVAVLCVIMAWFAILFTGRYPKVMFEFVVGVYRWALRVDGYALLLVTDRYPPFSLK